MKKNIHIIIILLGLVFLSSCEKEALTTTFNKSELNKDVEEGYADLVVSVSPPSLNIMSRGMIAEYPKDTTKWTVWDKFVDGSLLYHVTLFVIEDTSGKLVAYRHFYTDSPDIQADDPTTNKGDNGFYEGYTENALWSGTVNTTAKTGVAVKATFKASSPLHGDMERLKPGDYTIIAVANYSPIVASANNGLLNTTLGLDATQTYSGLGNVSEDGDAETGIANNNNGTGGDFTSLVNGLTTDVTTDDNEFAGVDNVFSKSLFAYQLNSGADRVCKQLPQPLVMIRKKRLVAGNNQLEGMLSRTFARVRVEVKNNDEVQFLGVHGFHFKDGYASRRAYLFNDVYDGDDVGSINDNYVNFELYDETGDSIYVSSADAMIPFTANDVDDIRRLPTGSTFPMFDCYILEGKLKNSFAFKFMASYWSSGKSGQSTPELHITKFYPSEYENSSGNNQGFGQGPGSQENYGLLEYNVFIRCETGVMTDVENGSSSTVLLGAGVNANYDNIMIAGTPDAAKEGITLGTTYIDPEYIWQITLNKSEEEAEDLVYGAGGGADVNGRTNEDTSTAVGFESGSLVNLESGLYLQAYDGGDDKTPKLGVNPDNTLIFKIMLLYRYEVGTVFCKVGNSFYYLKYNSTKEVVEWTLFEGTLDKDVGEYKYFTWETIGGTAGTRTDVPIEKTIENTSEENATNEIVRNDFFYGIIPISYSSSSANTTTSASRGTSE